MSQRVEEVFRENVARLFTMLGYKTRIRKRVKGRSRMKHELDIVAEKVEIPVDRLILIKCKIREADPFLRANEVLPFWAQVFDLKADRGLIVTTCRTTGDAIKFSRHYGISVIEGRSYEELKSTIFQGTVQAISEK